MIQILTPGVGSCVGFVNLSLEIWIRKTRYSIHIPISTDPLSIYSRDSDGRVVVVVCGSDGVGGGGVRE